MKRILILFFTIFIFNQSSAQNTNQLIGIWKFSNVSTSNKDCKDVSYFPIETFNFKKNGRAEFKSKEGIAIADYEVENSIIKLTSLSKNGVDEKETVKFQFQIKNISKAVLTLKIQYECGSIDILFKRVLK